MATVKRKTRDILIECLLHRGDSGSKTVPSIDTEDDKNLENDVGVLSNKVDSRFL